MILIIGTLGYRIPPAPVTVQWHTIYPVLNLHSCIIINQDNCNWSGLTKMTRIRIIVISTEVYFAVE